MQILNTLLKPTKEDSNIFHMLAAVLLTIILVIVHFHMIRDMIAAMP